MQLSLNELGTHSLGAISWKLSAECQTHGSDIRSSKHSYQWA